MRVSYKIYSSWVDESHLHSFSDMRKITMKDLEDAAEEEVGKSSSRVGFRRQDSEAARMYN